MSHSKQELYRELVEKRKNCTVCNGIKNPSIVCSLYDKFEIGPWTIWQGSLDAKVMVVGQDWGDIDSYIKDKGMDEDNNPTNKNLVTLLTSIGIQVKGPESKAKCEELFFTNAILCLKDGEGGLQAETQDQWYNNCCRYFLKPLIEIVQPKAVVTLGEKAMIAILSEYNIKTRFKSFKQAVEFVPGIKLNDETTLFPVYHCGARGVNINRKGIEQHKKDWSKIKQCLN
jgi:DNA polymerase